MLSGPVGKLPASARGGALGSGCFEEVSRLDCGSVRTRPVGGRSKRTLDLVIASTVLLVTAPLMLLVIILTKVTSGGSVFFSHRRVGFNGQTFNCYKFRTMIENADEVLVAHLRDNLPAQREWNERRKLAHDPRISVLGRILRMSSLDELPQLLNVLKGEMSCVGPRPVVAEELERYGDLAGDYLAAKPGLTGLWQISGRSKSTYAERVRLDSLYVRSWSLWRDLIILAKTASAVMRFEETS